MSRSRVTPPAVNPFGGDCRSLEHHRARYRELSGVRKIASKIIHKLWMASPAELREEFTSRGECRIDGQSLFESRFGSGAVASLQ
jgi:hypothetical protein